jgi:hypothetical protein
MPTFLHETWSVDQLFLVAPATTCKTSMTLVMNTINKKIKGVNDLKARERGRNQNRKTNLDLPRA